MGKYDAQRSKPPTVLVLHHSVSPESDTHRKWSDQQWRDWFNLIGRSRTYAGFSSSEHYEVSTKRETFSAVPICLVPNGDGSSINDDSWRVVEIFDWYSCVGWHCGNWDMNCKSVGCETYGTWSPGEPFPENACKAIAKWTRENIEKRNGGKTLILGHREIKATACPGTILDQRQKIVDMVNNPHKYNDLIQTKQEDPKMVQELQNQINKLEQEKQAAQGLATQKTQELEQIKAEFFEHKERTTKKYFEKESEVLALQEINVNLVNKINQFESADAVEDNEFVEKIRELTTERDEARTRINESNSRIVELEAIVKSFTDKPSSDTTAPIVTESGGKTIGQLVDGDGKIQNTVKSFNGEAVKSWLSKHPKLVGYATIITTVLWFIQQIVAHLLLIQLPAEWNQASIAVFAASAFGAVYRINENYQKKKLQQLVTDVQKAN